MNIDDLLRDLGKRDDVPDAGAAEKLRDDFIRACRRVDESPAEQQRVDDIADLLDVEESLYDQALAAIDCGDRDTAVPLLRRCAEAGTGESAWLLAQLLEDAGDIQEAMTWYRRARAEGDPRAGEKWFGRGTRRRPLTFFDLLDHQEGDQAEAGASPPQIVFVSSHEPLTWPSTDLIDLITARPPAGGQGSRFLVVPDADFVAKLDKSLGRQPSADPDSVTLATDCLLGQYGLLRAAHHAHPAARDWAARASWLSCCPDAAASGSAPPVVAVASSEGHVRLWNVSTGQARTVSAASCTREAWAQVNAREGERRPSLKELCLSVITLLDSMHDARRPARKPVVGDMMVPSSEVPECGPYTPVDEALERTLQSGAPALPVCEMSRVKGIVTLADLARSASQGDPSAQTVKALMRDATTVSRDTPLAEIAQAIADDGIIVVSGPGGRPAGYLTAESVLAQVLSGADGHSADGSRPRLVIPGTGTGAVLLGRNR